MRFAKFVISIWNKEELSEEWKESITLPVYKKDDKTDFILNTYKILSKLKREYQKDTTIRCLLLTSVSKFFRHNDARNILRQKLIISI